MSIVRLAGLALTITNKQLELELGACARCGYSLAEQRVFVQEDLGMRVVRCPECGLGQGVGEDAPPRWTSRSVSGWRTVRWLVAALVVVLGIAGSIAGLAQSTGFAASRPLGEFMGYRCPPHAGLWMYVRESWWTDEGQAILAAEGKTAWGMVDWMVLTDLLWAVPIGLVGGLLYRAVFRDATRRGHQIAVGSIVCFSSIGLIAHVEYLKYLVYIHRGQAIDIAIGETGWVIMYGSWVVIAGCVLIGIRYGGRLLDVILRHLRGGPVGV